MARTGSGSAGPSPGASCRPSAPRPLSAMRRGTRTFSGRMLRRGPPRPARPRPATALTFPTRPETHGARVRPPPPPLEVPPASASLTDPSSACPPRPPLLLEAPSRPPQPRAAALSPPPCDPGCAQRDPCPPAGASEPGSAPAEALAVSGGPLASLPRSAGLGGPPSGVAGVVITLGFTWRKLPAHTSAVLRTVLITVKAGFITL